MTTGKEKLLNETYEQFIKLSIDALPIELTTAFVAENFMGYGTAIDEKLFSSSDYRDLLIRQREQAVGLNIKFEETPVFRRITVSEDVAIIVGEFVLSMLVEGSIHEIFMRLTTVMEFINGKWLAVHVHSSKPDNTLGETDTWHINEWKRKNEELQKLVDEKTADLEVKNGELVIEACLERVRTQAMSMKQPDDMVEVCRIISDQLQLLKVKDIRNIQTAIINEAKGIYLNYEYFTQYKTTSTLEIEIKLHPTVIEFVNEIQKSNDAFFTKTFEGEALQDWQEYRRKTNQIADPILDEATSVHYYFYSIGPGALGISTYAPLNEEDISVFRRFRNVFELAYRRFIDIEQAIAQAREAKIEAALERVRSKTMAMHNSQDVGDTVATMFDELVKLGVETIRCGILIIDETKHMQVWTASSNQTGKVGLIIGRLDMTMHPLWLALHNAWKNKQPSFSYELVGEDLINFFRAVNNSPEYPFKYDIESLPPKNIYTDFFFPEGAIFAFTSDPIPTEASLIFKRFAGVFGQTYRRYLDLQKAEAQAREAKIEAALERVRGKAMAMHSSEDLASTVTTFYNELRSVSVTPRRCGVALINRETRLAEISTMNTTVQGEPMKIIGTIKMTGHPVLENIFDNWLLQKEYHVTLRGPEIKKYYDVLHSHVQFPDYPHDVIQFGYYFMFPEGDVYTWTAKELSEEELQIYRKFTTVLSLTYKRYKDLRQAEAQAREAQIEAALERVRSRSMGMQKNEELGEVIQVIYEQLQQLNFKNWGAGFGMNYRESNDFNLWATDPHIAMPTKVHIPYLDHPQWNRFNEAKEKGLDFLANSLTFEEKNKFLDHLFKYIPGIPPEVKEVYYSSAGLAASHVLLKNVTLYICNYEGIPYTDAENATLMRFGKVFEQTFTRFNDLKQAEAQAREAQIEAALERVRARAMAMHKTNELLDAAELVSKELSALGVTSMNISYAFVDEEEKYASYYSLNPVDGKIAPFPFVFPHIETEVMRSILSSWKKQEPFNVIELDEEATLKHQTYIGELIQQLITKNNIDIPFSVGAFLAVSPKKAVIYSFNFTKGYLFIIGGVGLTKMQEEMVLRFTKVFEQTYTRFLDLQKAEAQAREAQIEAALERVRSRAMSMHSSNELKEVVVNIFEGMNKLGIDLAVCNIALINNETYDIDVWTAHHTDEGVSTYNVRIPYFNHPFREQLLESFRKEIPFSTHELSGELKKSYDHLFIKYVDISNVPDVVKLLITELPEIESLVLSAAYMKQGLLIMSRTTPATKYESDILQRFAKVFEQTYTRFLDLKNAEAQAMEAMRQASLDRVRAEIASMRSTEDLQRITPIIWRELKTLDVPFIRCGVFIVDETNAKVQVYLTTPEGHSLGVLNLPIDANNLTSNAVEHWRKDIVYKEHWNREEFINWTKSMIELGQIQNAETYQGSANPPESLDLYFVPFTQGMLYVGNTSPLTEEKIQLVKSLAEAFSIAYARYEDFKNLEEAKNQIEVTLSELKSAQAQLIHSEKMASLGELTAGIAHEIKNPLNFVNNFSEVSRELLDEMKTELQNKNNDEVMEIVENLKQNLEKINHHGKRADSIVKGMLLHSRGTSGEKVLTNINDLLDQYVTLAYHGLRAQNKEFNITIEKEYDGSLEKINVVPQDISRVFLNLINNACYAAYEKKKMSGNDFSPTLKVSTKNLQSKVEIRIRDNGNGIPESIKEQIFNPFFTTKPTGEGTGLGLSLSYDIVVKQHAGEIKFETEEGKYTEFIIILPKV